MKPSGLRLLLACLALALLESCAGPRTPPGTIGWSGHRFREVRSLSALPPTLQRMLGVGRGVFGIADRNEKFNPTDVVGLHSLPMRRFIVAGLEDDTALVAVEDNGLGWHAEATLFSDIRGRVVIEKRWTLPYVPDDLRSLRDYLSGPLR